jgi:hypothetical protein
MLVTTRFRGTNPNSFSQFLVGRFVGYWAARLSDFEANRGPWPLLLVTQLAALHDA